MNPPIKSLISTRTAAEHAKRRRPWTRAFSTAALKEYQPTIHKRGTQLAEGLANSCLGAHGRKGRDIGSKEEDTTSWTDLALWTGYFTYDFMGDLVYVLFFILTHHFPRFRARYLTFRYRDYLWIFVVSSVCLFPPYEKHFRATTLTFTFSFGGGSELLVHGDANGDLELLKMLFSYVIF